MPVNKDAMVRFRIIDRMLAGTFREAAVNYSHLAVAIEEEDRSSPHGGRFCSRNFT